MTTQHKNYNNKSGGSQNYVPSMYIYLKSPKSHDTVPLTGFRKSLGLTIFSGISSQRF